MRRIAIVLLVALLTALAAPAAQAEPTGGPGVTVVNSALVTDVYGQTSVVGQVRNNTLVTVSFIVVRADFVGAGGEVITVGSDQTALRALNPGDTATFAVPALVSGATGYRLRVSWQASRAPANHYFTVTVTDASTDADGLTHFAGTVRNDNLARVEFVQYEFTFFGADGQVLARHSDTIEGDEPFALEAGAVGAFSFVDTHDVPWQTWTVVADAVTRPTLGVTIATSPSSLLPVVYGSSVKVLGMAGPGAKVTIERWDRGGQWVPLGTTTAGSTGAYSLSLKILGMWYIRARTASGASAGLSCAPRALVTISASTATVRRGGSVTLSGMVRPAYAGKKVAIEQLKAPNWVTIGYATLSSASAWRYTWVGKTRGTFHVRAVIRNQNSSGDGVSGERTIVVR